MEHVWNLPLELPIVMPAGTEDLDSCLVRVYQDITIGDKELKLDLLCTLLGEETLVLSGLLAETCLRMEHFLFLGGINRDTHVVIQYMDVAKRAGARKFNVHKDDGLIKLFHNEPLSPTNPLVDHRLRTALLTGSASNFYAIIGLKAKIGRSEKAAELLARTHSFVLTDYLYTRSSNSLFREFESILPPFRGANIFKYRTTVGDVMRFLYITAVEADKKGIFARLIVYLQNYNVGGKGGKGFERNLQACMKDREWVDQGI